MITRKLTCIHFITFVILFHIFLSLFTAFVSYHLQKTSLFSFQSQFFFSLICLLFKPKGGGVRGGGGRGGGGRSGGRRSYGSRSSGGGGGSRGPIATYGWYSLIIAGIGLVILIMLCCLSVYLMCGRNGW